MFMKRARLWQIRVRAVLVFARVQRLRGRRIPAAAAAVVSGLRFLYVLQGDGVAAVLSVGRMTAVIQFVWPVTRRGTYITTNNGNGIDHLW